jgi:ligand-binding SRPBCC domain-containing protein
VESFTQSSVIDAPPSVVWERVTSFAGVNHELMPWMRMTPPRRYRDASITTVPTGVPLGRVTTWYLGFLPLDYDRMSFAEVVPGVSFHEVSTMGTIRHWEHQRTLHPVDDRARTRVTDTITFEPRLPGPVTGRTLRALFAHRHRRLAAHFTTTPRPA